MLKSASTFLRLGQGQRKLLLEALMALMAASLMIRFLPFRRIARAADRLIGRTPVGDEQSRIVRHCRWAVRSWARRVPWRAVCFQKGLALHIMLRRRGIPSVLHYGVAQDNDRGLTAHVWVSWAGHAIEGAEEAPNYICLARYPASDTPVPDRAT